MEIKIIWTLQAERGLSKTINYLEREWTEKEILRLGRNINIFINLIKQHPEIYPKTSKYQHLRKGMVDENNYIVYQIKPLKNLIVIVNFRNSKQKPIY